MPELTWGELDKRRYESGISRGVLYPFGGPGVAWNGLISVEEGANGGDIEPVYFEGIKVRDVVANRFFQGKLSAYSSPEEFDPCIGYRSIIPGFLLTRQPRLRFGLSYRTNVNAEDYKLHLIYNAIATPGGKSYSTLNNAPTPTEFEWIIDAVPPEGVGYKPTAHFVLDSTKTDFRTLAVLEQHLYGVPTNVPYLPTQNFLIDLLKADPDVIDGGSSSSVGPLPALLDGGSSSTVTTNVIDGRRSSTRRLEEFVYT